MKKKSKVKSVPQRNLMGYAYACASGKLDNCPTSIKKVADSFTKKKKGLESLRKMAKTKHASLSPFRISESHIIKFEIFAMKENYGLEDSEDQSSEVIEFLYNLKDEDICDHLHYYITIRNQEEKKEYIEDIMRRLNARKFNNLSRETKSWIEHHLKKRTL